MHDNVTRPLILTLLLHFHLSHFIHTFALFLFRILYMFTFAFYNFPTAHATDKTKVTTKRCPFQDDVAVHKYMQMLTVNNKYHVYSTQTIIKHLAKTFLKPLNTISHTLPTMNI